MRRPRCASALAASFLACFACSSPEPASEPIDHRSDSIVGGTIDKAQENDAVVMIYSGTSIVSGGMCTGALIAPNVVLTARHCVSKTTEFVDCYQDVESDIDPASLLVMRGYDAAHNMQGRLSKGKHVVHDGSTSLCGHDIALIVLEEDDVTGETMSQIPIVPLRVRVHKGPEMNELFTATGYGLTNPQDMNSAGLRYRREGVKVLRYAVGTGDADFVGTQSICQGDSGGPAISAQNAVMGVTSRGSNCFGDENIWTRTDRFKDLIDEAVEIAGTSYTGEDGTVYDGSPTVELCNDGVCRDGLTCVEGFHGRYCTQACDPAASACPTGTTCAEVGYCFLNEACTTAEDCAAGTVCVNDGTMYCTPKCGAGGPCPMGFTCAPELGACFKNKDTGSVYTEAGSDGCSQGGGHASGGWASLGVLVALGWMSRRRRVTS